LIDSYGVDMRGTGLGGTLTAHLTSHRAADRRGRELVGLLHPSGKCAKLIVGIKARGRDVRKFAAAPIVTNRT